MKLHKGQRYLKINGYVLPYTAILAKRKDAKEYIPDFEEEDSGDVTGQGEGGEPGGDKGGLVTEDFLMSRTKSELEKYAMDVYGVNLDKRENKESLVAQILELQQKTSDEE